MNSNSVEIPLPEWTGLLCAKQINIVTTVWTGYIQDGL